MKKIKSFYYEIVISKIYMMEKYKQEFDEKNIYNGIWGTLQTLFVFTACIILFILVHIYRTPQYKLSIALGTVILCLIVVNSYLMSNSCQRDNQKAKTRQICSNNP